jgi:hypothetical protein
MAQIGHEDIAANDPSTSTNDKDNNTNNELKNNADDKLPVCSDSAHHMDSYEKCKLLSTSYQLKRSLFLQNPAFSDWLLDDNIA